MASMSSATSRKTPRADAVLGQIARETLHHVQTGGAGGREVDVEASVPFQPTLDLEVFVGCIVIDELRFLYGATPRMVVPLRLRGRVNETSCPVPCFNLWHSSCSGCCGRESYAKSFPGCGARADGRTDGWRGAGRVGAGSGRRVGADWAAAAARGGGAADCPRPWIPMDAGILGFRSGGLLLG